MRYFEKISIEEFRKSTGLAEDIYFSYSLPKRSTNHSAGYDFFLLSDFTLLPGESIVIPTGVKVNMEFDEVFMIYVRSSLGFKYNIRMCNQVGVIDSDYFNNTDNEGHIFIKLINEGMMEKNFKAGEKFVQGVFTKYLVVDDEESVSQVRVGGIGSTNKEE